LPGSLSIPKRRSGDDKWKKLKACDWTSCARFMRRRSFAAVGGISTASNASHALATILVTFKGSPHFLSKAHQVSIAGRVALHGCAPADPTIELQRRAYVESQGLRPAVGRLSAIKIAIIL